MIGRRVHTIHALDLEAGDFALIPTQRNGDGPHLDAWWVRTPNGLLGRLSDEHDHPDHHHVEEHDDGLISVLPQPSNSNSIMVTGWPLGRLREKGEGLMSWHGFIRHGIWELV